MAETLRGQVLSHWSQLIENFQTSSIDFYVRVATAVQRRQAPNILISRVTWRESGVFSARREYLRVERGEDIIDICAAPFGTSFFFSSRLAKERSRLGCFYGILLLFVAAVLSVIPGLLLFAAGVDPATLNLIQNLMIQVVNLIWLIIAFLLAAVLLAFLFGAQSIEAIPFLGRFYAWALKPITYYRIDTALMFQKTVHNAMLEVIDELTMAKGLRGLSEDERKPIMHGLFGR